jgi:ATP diphosphatase
MKYTLDDLLYLMTRLRDKNNGCPWDIEQTFQSITSSTIEEVYELVDAIFQNDTLHIKEELGDVLFQVIFYSQLAKEDATFDFSDVVNDITEKLVRRHPHVFPQGQLYQKMHSDADVESVKEQWDVIKQAEKQLKQQNSIMDDIPQALPALMRTQKIQKRASRVGFDWPNAQSAISKIREELDELEQAIMQQDAVNAKEELGDLLFSCVNVARHLEADAESILAAANRKFLTRFSYIEESLKQQNQSIDTASFEDMERLWNEAKNKLVKK